MVRARRDRHLLGTAVSPSIVEVALANMPARVGPQRHSILEAAARDLGLREEIANRGRIRDGRGIDRFQPRHLVNGPWQPAPSYAYCSRAACTWWHDALGEHPYGLICPSCDRLQDAAIADGRYRRTHPIPGDAFVILHGPDKDGTITPGHVGLVWWVDPELPPSADDEPPQRGTILTIEANCRNAVRACRRSYDFGGVHDKSAPHGFVSPFAFDLDPVGYETGRGPWQGEDPRGSTR